MTQISLFIFILAILVISIRQINEYERGIKFTLGKFTKVMAPGWRLIIPIFQSMQKVDIRVKAVDVPDQEAITEDNISIRINAVIYYRVAAADRAILQVENFYYAVSQLAQTTMRNIVGEMDLDSLLKNRETASDKIREIIDRASDPWGIKVESVELKDIGLPEDMKRTMAKQAEAERERGRRHDGAAVGGPQRPGRPARHLRHVRAQTAADFQTGQRARAARAVHAGLGGRAA